MEVLRSVFRVTEAATSVVTRATTAAAELLAFRNGAEVLPVAVDPVHAALACRSERYCSLERGELPPPWDAVAGDYETADGWIKLHTNYAHHRAAALGVLSAEADRADVARAAAGWAAVDLETAVIEAGGVAAALRTTAQWRAHEHGGRLGEPPLVAVERVGDAPPLELAPSDRPLAGVRVLDLTRVIAGPSASRFLAAWGAIVTRVDPPGFEEVPVLWVDTGFGKGAVALDLRTERDAFERMVADADVVVTGYRPGALAALGYGPAQLLERGPRVVATLSAYGPVGPWAGRRGYDSLVQFVSGIADEERRGGPKPGGLPCPFLDHGTGYLLAAGAMEALRAGGATTVTASLARTARWLDDLGRVEEPAVEEPDPSPYLTKTDAGWDVVRHLRPPGTIGGAAPYWATPPARRP
jgi:hypothetical protein